MWDFLATCMGITFAADSMCRIDLAYERAVKL